MRRIAAIAAIDASGVRIGHRPIARQNHHKKILYGKRVDSIKMIMTHQSDTTIRYAWKASLLHR
jgi:ribosomal protein S2